MRLPAARLPALLSVGLVAVLSVLPFSAGADPSSESGFVSATSSARSQHGLPGYAVYGDLTSVARRWAAYMAAHRRLEHNPGYGSEVCCWTSIGENVGVGQTVSQIQQAFMSSPDHRANILSTSFTQVGIGTARSSDGRLWVDEVFRRPTGAAPQSAHRTTRTPTTVRWTVTRVVPSRASRSAVGGPRHPVRTPRLTALTLLARRIATARAGVATSYPDAVGGAVAYVQVMRAVDGSTGE